MWREKVSASWRGDKSKVQFNILERPSFSPLFNVLMRRENAAFISPANSSVIREEWREGEKRKREGWRGGKIGREGRGCWSGMQHWNKADRDGAMWKKKSDRSRNLTGTIDFFFLPSLECFLPPAASSQSAAIWEATWDARQLIGYLLSILLFLLFSPSCSFFKSPSQFPIISAQQFFFFFSWNFHPGDLSLLSVGLQRHDSPALSDFSLRLFSLKSRRLIFSSFLSLMMMTVNAHVEDAVWAVLRRWQVTIWKFATEVLSSYVAAFRDKQDALSLPLPRWCLNWLHLHCIAPKWNHGIKRTKAATNNYLHYQSICQQFSILGDKMSDNSEMCPSQALV